jgi:hypothetical protein
MPVAPAQGGHLLPIQWVVGVVVAIVVAPGPRLSLQLAATLCKVN